MSPKFEVLATGNSGQTFTADLALKGFSVRPKKILQNNLTLPGLWLQLMPYGALPGQLTTGPRDLCDDPATVSIQSYPKLKDS
jgi:hypothetical protein